MFGRIRIHAYRLLMLLTVSALLLIAYSTSQFRHSGSIKTAKIIKPSLQRVSQVSTSIAATSVAVPPSAQPSHSVHPPSDNYTRTLVVAKLKAEDTSWVDRLAENDPGLATAVYVVDDPEADPFVIKNKGHELMPYLTYIIDNYANLRNITIFMHAHNETWHNEVVLHNSSAIMVRRLRSEHVLREGYMNLRCQHDPGCPDHIHPQVENGGDDILAIPEAAVFGTAWKQLFPETPVPDVVAQPCCSQFAVSAERIRTIPLPRYVFWRDWVLRTPLPDWLTGRGNTSFALTNLFATVKDTGYALTRIKECINDFGISGSAAYGS
ncbi:hypothetical protein PRK78_006043 [Emydomyces testavorans]|uniref:Uncharacterized protein n=1 Tax=Emydomyces testavorans TaxID=2070801 RepID=A0AAF0DKN2_9EURO|nr:hypothetical protein PRK78_006043 [Emydomyces testavorans]